MSGHTPGPWAVEDIGANCLSIKALGGVPVGDGASDYYQRIGSATQRDPHPRFQGGIDRKVTAANARLMAASPEMLEALKSAKSTLVAFKFFPGHGNGWEEHDEAALQAVDAAIAKAEGQQ